MTRPGRRPAQVVRRGRPDPHRRLHPHRRRRRRGTPHPATPHDHHAHPATRAPHGHDARVGASPHRPGAARVRQPTRTAPPTHPGHRAPSRQLDMKEVIPHHHNRSPTHPNIEPVPTPHRDTRRRTHTPPSRTETAHRHPTWQVLGAGVGAASVGTAPALQPNGNIPRSRSPATRRSLRRACRRWTETESARPRSGSR